MIRIDYARRERRHTVTVTGHAGYARDGEPDIVCAAVSALTCTLLQCMIDLRAQKALECLTYKRNSGDVWIAAQPYPEAREWARAVFDTTLTGFSMIAEKYPAHVALNIDFQNAAMA